MKRERQILANQLAIMEALGKLLPLEVGYAKSLLYGRKEETRRMLAEPAMQDEVRATPDGKISGR